MSSSTANPHVGGRHTSNISTTNTPTHQHSAPAPVPQQQPIRHATAQPSPTAAPSAPNNPLPSSSTAGFFQTPPPIPNQFLTDAALQRALMLLLPESTRKAIEPDLTQWANRVLSPPILSHVLDAEKNPPYLRTWDTWGRRVDELVTSTGWQELQKEGIKNGIVGMPYENRYQEGSRIVWAAWYAIWCGSSAWVNCPSLMVDGVAALFRKHLSEEKMDEGQRKVIGDAYRRLTSRETEGVGKAWTTGQWMTERQGGSDVSMTETLARFSPELEQSRAGEVVKASDGNALGPWLVDGFKWFSSATDADMMVFLARTQKGISTFFAPMRKTLGRPDPVTGRDTELNGVYIQRLKNKLGTRALPTAELELRDVRAWLVGEEGKGTKEIATVLNIARVHNGMTAIGFWGRGLAVVRAFASVRKVGGRPLGEKTAFVRSLARMHLEYRANVLFNMFVAGLLGIVEQEQIAVFDGQKGSCKGRVGRLPGVKDEVMAEWLLRLLTPALKGVCSKTAIAGLQECMECMGGVGYLENEDMQYNIARLYRDANVLPIWEGTTDMMADDSIVRVLFRKTREDVMAALTAWVETLLEQEAGFDTQKNVIREWWMGFRVMIDQASKEEVEMKARAMMDRLVDIVQGLLLLADAQSDGDEIAGHALESWVAERQNGGSIKTDAQWQDEAGRDMMIVFGRPDPIPETVRARL